MKKKNLKAIIAMMLALVMCFATACGNTDSSDGQGGEVGESTLGLTALEERTTLSIGFFAGSAHSAPWYIADQMGFFRL